MTLITGNTYPVKDQIKAIGGRWDAERRGWLVPDAVADQARALVAGGAAAGGVTHYASRRPTKCRCCGHVERRNSRGYVEGDRILRSGECQSCYEERKMGY